MKTFVCTLIAGLLMAPGFAHAAPNDILPQSPALVRYVSGGGFPGPDGSRRYELTLHEDGSVVTENTLLGRDGLRKKEIVVAMKFEAMSTVKRVSVLVANSVEAKLVRGDDSPPCADVPYQRYLVVNGATSYAVAKSVNCQIYLPEDAHQRGIAQSIRDYLKDLDTRANSRTQR